MNKKDIEKGATIEAEHLKSLKKYLKPGVNLKNVARTIAKDHIKEDKNYYNKLAKSTLSETRTPFVIHKAKPPYNAEGKTNFNIRNKPGVYIVYKKTASGRQALKYIGFSRTDVYKALYRHLQSWEDPKQTRITFKQKNNLLVKVIYCKNAETAQKLEGALILKYKPLQNINKYKDFIIDETERKLLKQLGQIKPGIYEMEGDLPF